MACEHCEDCDFDIALNGFGVPVCDCEPGSQDGDRHPDHVDICDDCGFFEGDCDCRTGDECDGCNSDPCTCDATIASVPRGEVIDPIALQSLFDGDHCFVCGGEHDDETFDSWNGVQ